MIEILTEEESMEIFLREVIFRLKSEGSLPHIKINIRPHEGLSHLKSSLPSKLSQLRENSELKMIITLDQDSNDCLELKEYFTSLVKSQNVSFLTRVKIRIICRKLENIYFGDPSTLRNSIPKSRQNNFGASKQKANPDSGDGLRILCDLFGYRIKKTDMAKAMGRRISIADNNSSSFNHLINSIRMFSQTN
jgi:hypothetical protein